MTNPNFRTVTNFFDSFHEPTPESVGFSAPDFNNPVREDGIHYSDKSEHLPYATFHYHNVTMENGANYNVVTTEIPEKNQKEGSDIPNIETTAWLTKPDGMNRRRMDDLARLAIPSVFVSIQQNTDRIGHLDRNAHNELEIAKAMADIYGFSDEYALANGISRGGMTALAVSSLAKQHNIEVPYVDSIVPCFPRGINLRRDLADYIHLLPNETNSLRAIREVPAHYLRQYPHTVDASLHGLFQQLKEIPTLISGSVGRQIDEHMDADTFGHISVYKGDIMSQGSRWKTIFNDHNYPNMIVDLKEGGGHLSCVGNDCHEEWLDRMHTITDIFHDNYNNRKLGGTALRAEAALRNSVFRQGTDDFTPVVDDYII